MSKLTRCNYCTLRIVRENAGNRDQAVHLLPEKDGGTTVLVCPVNTVPDREAHWSVWMMAVTDHCVC